MIEKCIKVAQDFLGPGTKTKIEKLYTAELALNAVDISLSIAALALSITQAVLSALTGGITIVFAVVTAVCAALIIASVVFTSIKIHHEKKSNKEFIAL
jgi:uncharacterized protein (DUF169 family)